MSDISFAQIEEAVTDLLDAKDAAAGERAVRREMSLYLSAPGKRRDVLAARILAIRGLPPSGGRTAADVAAVGAQLGLKQSAVYRLLKKVARHGPVSGLLPGHGIEPRPAPVRDGFGDPVDAWIDDVMRLRPNAGISDILGVLASKAAMLGATSRPKLPTQTALRRRVHHLRKIGPTGVALDPPIGERLLVAQCAMDLLVEPDGADDPAAGPASGIFIIDERTSIVLGSAIYLNDDVEIGLALALSDARSNVRWFEDERVSFVPTPSAIRWFVPDSLIKVARDVLAKIEADQSGVNVNVVTGPPCRNGREIYGYLGEFDPPFRLLPRELPGGSARTRYERRQSGHHPGRHRSAVTPGVRQTNFGFRHVISERNGRIIAVGSGAVAKGGFSVVMSSRTAADSGSFQRLAEFLSAIFAPVRAAPTYPMRLLGGRAAT